MNSAHQSPGPARAHKRFWLATLGWFTASLACVAVAGASMPHAGWGAGLASSTPGTPVVAAAETHRSAAAALAQVLSPRGAAHCRTCGIVEIVRTVRAAGAAPAGYELTVRLRDGSRRISSQSDSAHWRVGDSIMLLGGAKLPERV